MSNIKSEFLTDEWLKWLLEIGFSAVDNLMYEHWAVSDGCECPVCTAFHHSTGDLKEKKTNE